MIWEDVRVDEVDDIALGAGGYLDLSRRGQCFISRCDGGGDSHLPKVR